MIEQGLTREEQWVLEEKYSIADVRDFVSLYIEMLEEDRHRLARGEPVAYVIGWQPFLGLKIYLDSHPLIPRPETEWWVEQLLAQMGNGGSGVSRRATARGAAPRQQAGTRPPKPAAHLRVLDLCAGSGAIGCAMLASLPSAEVYFGEVDSAHEATIKKNIREACGEKGMIYHTLPKRARVSIGDLFEPFPADMCFDVIACNPPYVPEGRALPTSVADFEPVPALYAGADGLALIRRIAHELPSHLNPGGTAWIECDSAHAQEACALFADAGLSAQIRTDQYGAPRVIRVAHDSHSLQ